MSDPAALPLAALRERLTVAAVCDALDALGRRRQSPALPALRALTVDAPLMGRCRTTRWVDVIDVDPRPYELELLAVDGLLPGDILVAATGGSLASGIWGELLSTAALARGAVGVVTDGAVRDVAPMTALQFPVHACGVSPYDSRDRQRVVAVDVPVELGGVQIDPGDLLFIDRDGTVVIPQHVEAETLRRAWDKVHAENAVRDALRGGMSATLAFAEFGVL